jgi:hypothetical protein
MTKIVYNACYGGFSLSREAVLKAREISGNPDWGGACIKGDVYHSGEPVPYDYGHCDDISRTDSILVQVVEELGSGKASGDCARLAITEVQAGDYYRIDEYDGYESVMTRDDYDWERA